MSRTTFGPAALPAKLATLHCPFYILRHLKHLVEAVVDVRDLANLPSSISDSVHVSLKVAPTAFVRWGVIVMARLERQSKQIRSMHSSDRAPSTHGLSPVNSVRFLMVHLPFFGLL